MAKVECDSYECLFNKDGDCMREEILIGDDGYCSNYEEKTDEEKLIPA